MLGPSPTERTAVTQTAYHPATFALQALIAQSNAVERELARLLGLNPTDYRALATLQQLPRDEAVTMGRLAGALGATAATTTAIVDRLERAGYVVRHREEADRRQVTLEPTPLGWTRIAGFMRPLMAASDAYLKGLTPEDAGAVGDFLRATVAHLTQHLEALTALEADR